MTDTYELPPLGSTPHNVTIFGPGGHTRVSAFLAADVEAYARLAVKQAVDDMQSAIMNGELPAACEDAADWLERYATAIRKG